MNPDLSPPVWWLDPDSRPNAAPDPGPPQRGLPARVEVLVVGGGITGTALLHHLGPAPGTLLLEQASLGSGASGRNAGFLLAGVASNYAEACRLYTREVAGQVWELTMANHQLLAEALYDQDVGHRRVGSLVAAATAAEARELEESLALMREDGFGGEWRGEGLGAIFNPRDGEVDPLRAVRALAWPVADSIVEGVRVLEIEPIGRDLLVRTDHGELRAGACILANNAWIGELAPGLPVSPTRAQMLASTPVRPGLVPAPTYSHHGFRYWRQLEDGRVLVGGYRDVAVLEELGHGLQTSMAVQSRLEAHLAQLAPGAEIQTRWAGTMGFSPDGLPLVGPVPQVRGLWVCGGYTGHGMGFAFRCAELLVQALRGRGTIPSWLYPGRFGEDS